MANASNKNTVATTVGLCADRLSSTLALDAKVSTVKAVSPARAAALAKMGIYTVRDLLNSFPRRYIDLSNVETIRSSSLEKACTIAGVVHELKLKRPKPRLNLVEITLVDATGTMIVTCFRQPWLMDKLAKGMRVAVSGTVTFDYGYKRMTNPFLEVLEEGKDVSGGIIIPVHPACEKITTAHMRRIVRNALDMVSGMQDPLPLELRQKYCLMSRASAYEAIHFPHSMEDVVQARRRLVYEEVLLLELSLMQETEINARSDAATAHVTDGPALAALREAIPFSLTADQSTAVQDILQKMADKKCMNHLLLGDVGTGKTVVAAFALAAVADSGKQAFMMAPTEVLARQYAQSLGGLLDKVGVSWGMLTGSSTARERADVLSACAEGRISVLFGTHALLEDAVQMPNCSLVVIDEQQRFGVDQRAKLLAKADAPDALYLTATPIPRTLALALFGNLTLSYLHTKPHAQVQRTTTVLDSSCASTAYEAAREALERGEQVYVVCPLIDSTTAPKEANENQDEEHYEYASISIESDEDFGSTSLASATRKADQLRKTSFYGFEVGLLHGKMSGAEKQEVMRQFRSGELDALVSTTVIEVGVDVPNATVMIIEDADRFGLSQLHQLRGRVGRAELSAQVFLISSSNSETAIERLSAMERSDDGFELATYDLSLRREGDILGNRQHGASSLKLVNVVRDGKVIQAAHDDARALLVQDVLLEAPGHKPLAREVRFATSSNNMVSGG